MKISNTSSQPSPGGVGNKTKDKAFLDGTLSLLLSLPHEKDFSMPPACSDASFQEEENLIFGELHHRCISSR